MAIRRNDSTQARRARVIGSDSADVEAGRGVVDISSEGEGSAAGALG